MTWLLNDRKARHLGFSPLVPRPSFELIFRIYCVVVMCHHLRPLVILWTIDLQNVLTSATWLSSCRLKPVVSFREFIHLMRPTVGPNLGTDTIGIRPPWARPCLWFSVWVFLPSAFGEPSPTCKAVGCSSNQLMWGVGANLQRSQVLRNAALAHFCILTLGSN